MLHEILFALLGKTGNIIIEENNSFILDPRIHFLNNSEIQAVNSLVCLGYYYKYLEQFLDENYESFSKIQFKQEEIYKIQDLDECPIAENIIIGNSAYIKGFCLGLEETLDNYREEIVQIEKQYLTQRAYTISSLKIHLTSYFDILPSLHNTIIEILEGNLKGGQLLEFIYNKGQSGNTYLRDVYQILMNQCYQVLFQQLSSWLLYGNLQDFYNEFFIYRIEEVQKQIKYQTFQNEVLENDWDNVFSLRYPMLPQILISHKQAEKILFIGKGIRILRNTQVQYQQSFLPLNNMLQLVQELSKFDSFKFQNNIEQLRHEIAKQLLDLVLKKENLMKYLGVLDQYFFLKNGEFFKAFFEETRTLMQLPPKAETENILNDIIVTKTIMKLKNDEESISNMKDFRFKIKNNGFDFKDFSSINELTIVGNVSQNANKYLRFQPMKNGKQSGSLWYNFKQNIENGFKLNFRFRFKKERNFLMYKYNQYNKFLLSEKQKKIKITQKKILSYIQLIQKKQGNHKENLLFNHNLNELIDFTEEQIHYIKIQYDSKKLILIFEDKQAFQYDMAFKQIINLDMGRSYIGFLQDSINGNCAIDIYSFQMINSNVFNNEDCWNGLMIEFQAKWPLNLMISSHIIEKYKLLFRYLFPINQVQLELYRTWLYLVKNYRKQALDCNLNNVFKLKKQLSIVIQSIWVYFHNDVIENQWNKLQEKVKEIQDFEELRKLIELYLNSIQCQVFLTEPSTIKTIFDIINICRKFNYTIANIEILYDQFDNIRNELNEQIKILLNQLIHLTKTTNSSFIYQLILRLDYNEYYRKQFI
ncbi:hypothetical protein IMG5_097950 [Ichthyophthirius multifiliis]|uniref:Spindle pole body component n=1 Tax=Ichthyophthirius multifiliis TaxID=5932 RepID=G0QRV7_ICHMU|nr:hypothetical protein IMG5_097950 [Ichthyophthirius multifiliis]EGR32048.1 hypothetical protein IMG5_097950 [Ichthyophthirius multifiliis]|eukprot:XP_004035534.1 hypothetical protein IMG5_097950 [Ichthyophthirius multifiliis]